LFREKFHGRLLSIWLFSLDGHYGLIAGHLTGCGGADPHNSPTSASSASLGHFFRIEIENYYIQTKKQLFTVFRSKNSEEIDHFKEVIYPKQRQKDALGS